MKKLISAALVLAMVLSFAGCNSSISIIMKENGYIKTYVPREDYFLVQTPQGFKFKDIYDVHEEMKNKNQLLFTDDASLLVKKGKKIKLIYGDRFNFKITTLDDLMLLRSILEAN